MPYRFKIDILLIRLRDLDSLAIVVSIVDATWVFNWVLILQTTRPGNGVRLFNQSGKYRLRVSSTLARWQLKVEQITAAEAESYKPK
jgi:hypothetical protein